MTDVWHFYRAERLYSLRILKEVLSNVDNHRNKHQSVFHDIFHQMEEINLKSSLFKQLKAVIAEKPPSKETHGSNFSESMVKSWVHFNLREQSELLQLIILYYHCSNQSWQHLSDLKHIWDIAQSHKFCRQTSTGRSLDSDATRLSLVEGIRQLESFLIVYCMNQERSDAQTAMVETDNLILSSLGNLAEHGPIMLAWMLVHFQIEGESSLVKYRNLGERAIQLQVIKYLIKAAKNDVVNSNARVSEVFYKGVYKLLNSLLTAFDPERMGLTEDVHQLATILLKQDTIAEDLWDQKLENGVGMHLKSCMAKFHRMSHLC